MKSRKTYSISRFWWVIPVIIFDFLYYYFVQHLVERKSDNLVVEIHGEALAFLFLISLLSIGCVRLSDRFLARFNFQRLSIKYLISIFLSFLLYIVILIGVQYLFENGARSRPISYLFNQSMIFLFLHLVLGNAAIAVSYFINSKRLSDNLLHLEKVKAEMDLKILQQQMSPHFLFNNLNTLISLIPIDPQNAIEFTRRLSAVFRHATDHANKELISLESEMLFLDDYMELLYFRFGNSYAINKKVNAEGLSGYLSIPLTLQVLIENVIKHNTSSKNNPLDINITLEMNYLVNSNSIRAKMGKKPERIGVGLANLQKQYELVTAKKLEIVQTEAIFCVKIPLIKELQDEDIDY